MRRFPRCLSGLLLTVLLLLPVGARAAPPASYLRVVRDASGRPRTLQTAIGHFVLGSGQHVDLVAALHLGEPAYYGALNERFRSYDAVLYELILDTAGHAGKPIAGIVIPHADGHANLLTQVQMALSRMLGLRFQLDAVNYAAPNFRHADMTAAEFEKAMARNGESPLELLVRIFAISLEHPTEVDASELDQINFLDLLSRSPTPEEQMILRRALAPSFQHVEDLLAEVQGSTLVAGRDARAMAVLQQQLQAGARRLAIFYGGAHMPDLQQRLLSVPGTRFTGIEWLDAWRLTAPAAKGHVGGADPRR